MKALEHFENGYSCSESIIKEAIDLGICDETILPAATAFSAGMSSGCLCGAIAAVQLVIGTLYGKNNKFNNELKAREVAAQFIQEFKKTFPATCCRVLSKDYVFHSPERREHCKLIVEHCSKLMNESILQKV